MENTPKHNESGTATLQAGGLGGLFATLMTLWMPDYAEAWVPLGMLITVGWGYFLKSRNAPGA